MRYMHIWHMSRPRRRAPKLYWVPKFHPVDSSGSLPGAWMFWILFVTVAVVVGAGLVLIQRQSARYDLMGMGGAIGEQARYEQKRPLSEAEQVLYWRLVEALPECIIMAQVPFTRFMKPATGGKMASPHLRAANARIAHKSVDFLVCLRDF